MLVTNISCPNCGSEAERQYFFLNTFSRSHCPICDYLIVNCDRPQRSFEAYKTGVKDRQANLRYANKLFTSYLHTIAYRGSDRYE